MESKFASIEIIDNAIKETAKAIGLSEPTEIKYDVVTVPLKPYGTSTIHQILCIRCMVEGHHLEKFHHSDKLVELLQRVPTDYSSTPWPTNFLPWDVVNPRTLEAIGTGNPILFESLDHTAFIIDINKLLSKTYPNIPSNHVFWCHDRYCRLTALPSDTDIYDTPWESYPYRCPAYDTRLMKMKALRIEENELATVTQADLEV